MECTYCNCIGHHEPGCVLGRRLKIKYNEVIQRIWDIKGAEATEDLIDKLMETSLYKEG